MKKAVFIDKDGTLIRDVPYNINPKLIFFEEGVVEGLQVLQSNGFLLVVISNQAGIAHGYFTDSEFQAARDYIVDTLRKRKVNLDAFYYCPHHPEGIIASLRESCSCRKPKPGMILQAMHDLKIDAHQSWMIGDILDDVEAGNRAGCKSILIDNGNETEWVVKEDRTPTKVVNTFMQAVTVILETVITDKRSYDRKME